jgi:DNA-binding response OmpR family regulator
MQARNADNKTVLIADDDAWLREMLSMLLAEEGIQALEARTGPETLEVARESRPDAILLDIGLPGHSGFDVLEDLRRTSSTHGIPVMLVSGEINLKQTGRAFAAAATFHKPLDFGAFLAKVHEATQD